MSMCVDEWTDAINAEIQKELKANRKKIGQWHHILHHLVGNPAIAARSIVPRGMEVAFLNGVTIIKVPKYSKKKGYYWEIRNKGE